MNPARKLKRLLRGSAPLRATGSVLEAAGQRVRVATARGVVEARSVDATAYRAGDEVLVAGGIVQGRVKRAADIPVYQV